MAPAAESILTIDELTDRVRGAQAAGATVVLCHGCFDLVHPGHVRHLAQARRLGDRLVVTVTPDAAVGKGDGRPLIPQELRAENLAALDCVDWVAVAQTPTAAELLNGVRPDVYVKGQEYESNSDPRFAEEKRIVESYGGRVVFSSGDVIFSSTALIGELERAADPSHATVRRLLDRMSFDADEAGRVIESFRGRSVLVVGETIIDTYVRCARPDVTSEGPMLTLRPIEYRSFDGGAAIVARHLAALGARPRLLTVMPDGAASEAIRLRLEVEGVEIVPCGVARPLIEKQRFLVGPTKMMKLEIGERLVLDAADRRRMTDIAAAESREVDAVVIADYGLGLLSAPSVETLCAVTRPHIDLLVCDVSGRRSNLMAVREADLLCPSEDELRDAVGAHDDGLSATVCRLLDETRSRAALVTLAEEGLIAFRLRPDRPADDWEARLAATHVPALSAQAVDPLGCGDALLAAATLTLLAGRPLEEAALYGAVAAASEARLLGNAVISSAMLRRGLHEIAGSRLRVDARAASAPTSAGRP